MTTPRRPADLLAIVAAKLSRLPRRVVFVGGATTELFITDPAAPEVRATIDVDVIVQAASYAEYANAVASELRALGAMEDTSQGAPMCRWVLDDVLVDVMAPTERVLGFINRWYEATLRESEERTLPDGTVIRVATGPLFLATKVEAFRGRGGGDFWSSRDMEDIVTVLDGRMEIIEEVAGADDELNEYLGQAFAVWLDHPDFRQAVSGHLAGDADSQKRADVILGRIREMVGDRR